MQSKKVTSARVEKAVNQVAAPQPQEPVVPEMAVRKRSMPSAGGGSMDDMFAAAAHMGRLSMRPDDTESEGEE